MGRAIFHDSIVFKYHVLLFPVRDSSTNIMFERIDFQFSFSLLSWDPLSKLEYLTLNIIAKMPTNSFPLILHPTPTKARYLDPIRDRFQLWAQPIVSL